MTARCSASRSSVPAACSARAAWVSRSRALRRPRVLLELGVVEPLAQRLLGRRVGGVDGRGREVRVVLGAAHGAAAAADGEPARDLGRHAVQPRLLEGDELLDQAQARGDDRVEVELRGDQVVADGLEVAAGVETTTGVVAGSLLAREPGLRRPRPLEPGDHLRESVSPGRDGVALASGRSRAARSTWRARAPAAAGPGPRPPRRRPPPASPARRRRASASGASPSSVAAADRSPVARACAASCSARAATAIRCRGRTARARPACSTRVALGGDLGVAGQERVAFAGRRGVPAPLLRGRPGGVELAAGRLLGHPERRQRGGQRAGEVVGRATSARRSRGAATPRPRAGTPRRSR